MISEQEMNGRILTLQKQRNDALDQVVIMTGKAEDLAAQVSQLTQELEELKRRATESVEADSAPSVQ